MAIDRLPSGSGFGTLLYGLKQIEILVTQRNEIELDLDGENEGLLIKVGRTIISLALVKLLATGGLVYNVGCTVFHCAKAVTKLSERREFKEEIHRIEEHSGFALCDGLIILIPSWLRIAGCIVTGVAPAYVAHQYNELSMFLSGKPAAVNQH